MILLRSEFGLVGFGFVFLRRVAAVMFLVCRSELQVSVIFLKKKSYCFLEKWWALTEDQISSEIILSTSAKWLKDEFKWLWLTPFYPFLLPSVWHYMAVGQVGGVSIGTLVSRLQSFSSLLWYAAMYKYMVPWFRIKLNRVNAYRTKRKRLFNLSGPSDHWSNQENTED